MANYYNEDIDKYTDWGGDESTGGLPVSGSSVQRFIKGQLKKKVGDVYYDEETVQYLMFADDIDRELYLSDRTTYRDLLIANFDAPAPYTISLDFSTNVNDYFISGRTGITIDYTFEIKDSSGSTVNDTIQVIYKFNNSGNTQTATQIYNYGTSVSFNVDKYLSNGVNVITMLVTGRSTNASKVYVVNYTIIKLDISTTFDVARSISTTDQLVVPYKVSGIGTKYIEFYLDGVKVTEEDVVIDSEKEKNFYINHGLSAGKHNLQIRARLSYDDVSFYSNVLYREFVVSGIVQKQITIAQDFEQTNIIASGALIIYAEQYVAETISWGYYNNNGTSAQITWKLGDEEITTMEAQVKTAEVGTAPDDLSFMPTKTGNLTLKALINGVEIASYTVLVSANSSGIAEATDEMKLKLSALGRSNTEKNVSVWKYGDITTQFNGFAWTDNQGWKDNALVISGGAQAIIDYEPLNHIAHANGATVEVEFSTSNVSDVNAEIIKIHNDDGTGISITASSAQVKSYNGTIVSTKFRDGEKIKLAFIINKNAATTEACLTYIQNNGILERGKKYDINDNYTTSSKIILGNADGEATLKVYSIRCYTRAITTDEEFNNFIIDSGKIAEKIAENDVYKDGTTEVDIEKMQGKLPVMLFTGAVGSILMASSSKSTTIYADVVFTNPDHPEKNFTIEHAKMKLQGTSSLGYPRKNFKLYSKKKDSSIMYDSVGNVVAEGLYAFKDGDVPVNTWTLKADFSDSSCTHNSTIARLFGDIEPLVLVNGEHVLDTPPQAAVRNLSWDFPYDLRTTPNSQPMVCFYREDEESEYIFLGQYNMLNDKSNEYVYGFRSIYNNPEDPFYFYSTKDKSKILWDNADTHCYEVLDNTSPMSTFSTVDGFFDEYTDESGVVRQKWETAFESRYPELEDDVPVAERTEYAQPLYDFISWMVSVQGNLTKFEAEVEDHIDLYKMASYYVYLMRFGAVDQVQKNMMWTTYDGQHWFSIRYDNDTILGLRNDLHLVFDYLIDRQSKDPENPNTYAYAGHNSWLWNVLESSDKFMNIVRAVDGALYSAGLNYTNVCRYFDTTTSDRWCERIYNDNGRYKYVEPLIYDGKDYLEALQGKRQSHRHWWLRNRFNLYDALYLTGEYTDKAVRVIAAGTPANTDMYFKAGATTYYGWGANKVPVQTGVYVEKGNTFTLRTLTDRALAVGDPVYIYASNNLEEIDLHNLAPYFSSTLDFSKCYDDVLGTNLKKLVIGVDLDNTTLRNTADLGFGGFDKMDRLEYLDVRGLTAVTSFPITAMVNLKTFLAAETGLASFTCANGCHFTKLQLPTCLRSISINKVTWDELDYTIGDSLTYVEIKNVGSNANVREFIFDYANYCDEHGTLNKTLKIDNINWVGVDAADVLKLAAIGTTDIRGYIKLNTINSEIAQSLIDAFGTDTIFQYGANLVIDANAAFLLSGNSSVLCGNSMQLRGIAFPVADEELEVKYEIVGGTETTEDGVLVSKLLNSTLQINTGLLKTEENGTATNTISVRGTSYKGGTLQAVSSPFEIEVTNRNYPTAVAISKPKDTIDQTGRYEYKAVFTPAEFNGNYTQQWTYGETTSGTFSSDGDTLVFVATNTSEDANIPISYKATFKDGSVLQQSLTIVVHQSAPILTSITNAPLMAWMYEHGYAAVESVMYDLEAWVVTTLDFDEGHEDITSLEEIKHFKGLESIDATNLTNLSGTIDFSACNYIEGIRLGGSASAILPSRAVVTDLSLNAPTTISIIEQTRLKYENITINETDNLTSVEIVHETSGVKDADENYKSFTLLCDLI